MVLGVNHDFYYRNVYARMIFQTVNTAYGREQTNHILELAGLHKCINSFPPENFDREFNATRVTRLFNAIAVLHGTVQQLSLAEESGRAIARHMLTELWGHNLDTLPFRTRTLEDRINSGLNILQSLLGEFDNHHVSVSQRQDRYIFTLERCEKCAYLKTSEVTYRLMLGFLEQGLRIFSLGECGFRGDLTTVPTHRGGIVDEMVIFRTRTKNAALV
jgi:hypothetical protein